MEKSVKELQEIARKVRQDILKMVYQAGSGHLGGSFSSTDLLVALYFGGILNYDPAKPGWEERDRFLLSAGHYCPALYAVLAKAGFFPEEKLSTYTELGSPLQGHPHNLSLPGIETSSGPLGQGLSQAVGMAMVAKMDKKSWRVYCLMSDAEQDEGQTWEAAMTAAKYKLDNLVGIIDRNRLQIDGSVEEIMPLGDLKAKYEAFGWEVETIDGHDMEAIFKSSTSRTGSASRTEMGKPLLIIAKTVFGKRVSFMENNYRWHSHVPSEEEFEKALEELKK